jgi:hypothetical protein
MIERQTTANTGFVSGGVPCLVKLGEKALCFPACRQAGIQV